MTATNAVYKLQKICDDPRFEGFGIGKMPEALPLDRKSRDWKVKRLARGWKPLLAKGRVRPFNDFPCGNLIHPVFSARAVEALRDLLEPNGELLPLSSAFGDYFFFNVTTVADVLDWKKSDLKWFEGKQAYWALNIRQFQFVPKKLEGLSIFRLAEYAVGSYVTEVFRQRVLQHGLNGFDFIKVWPLPKGADFRALHKLEARKSRCEGLPAGQTIKGNTLILHLKLESAEASKSELAFVDALEDQLDALLVNDSEAPPVGNLEGHDFQDGCCHLVLSCPNAAALHKALTPWLKKLKWKNGARVTQHQVPFHGLADF